ncbi:MAG: GNAT family N-acetyltransferase [Pseudoalteromonas sp.]|uniref:GNAT family N-acetyltransferase n=1 Tax=Pseudoalteromonas sp. KS88 TaxID=2109918 RepID=UPI001080306C|nr:GNAT family N-acetyltransferase [Pseudoalteromonas sp. KS88]TGE84408.1 N-acetyltransferase [Pseudoalteromonas sp. KS88]
MPRFERLTSIKTPLVNKFYAQHNARGRANRQDAVWVAYDGFDIIAACRMQNRGGYLFLSTVLVAPHWRKQGVASALIKQATFAQQGVVYTFAYENLIHFYQSIGFNFVLTLPASLKVLFKAYEQRNIVPLQCSIDENLEYVS